MNPERRNAISAILDGARDFIPARDISAVLGIDITTLNVELNEMEIDGLVYKQNLHAVAGGKSFARGHRKGSVLAWKLRDEE